MSLKLKVAAVPVDKEVLAKMAQGGVCFGIRSLVSGNIYKSSHLTTPLLKATEERNRVSGLRTNINIKAAILSTHSKK